MESFPDLLTRYNIGETVSPLLVLGVLVVAGALGGMLARRMHLPSITGNIVAGVLIGPYCFGIVAGEETIRSLTPLSSFAMSLITVYIGGLLSYRRIHNAIRRIGAIGVGEALGAAILVGSATYALTGSLPEALLLSSLAVASAPATIIHIVREARAKGTFVKTLLGVVAVDNILAIVIFAVLRTIVRDFYASGEESRVWYAMGHIAWQLFGSVVLGLGLGALTAWVVKRPHFHHFSMVFLAVLFSQGLSTYCGVSPLLTSLTLGVWLGNSSRVVEEQLRALEPLEWMLFIIFFTLAGVNLHLTELMHIGWVGAAFVLARVLGKGVGATAGGLLAGSSQRIWQNIPLALMPQAGLAIALLVTLQTDPIIPAEVRNRISTLVLAAVVVNEVLGPLATRFSIRRVREERKDRPRLIEFLQEEFITVNMQARDKFDAIRQLTEFLVLTHQVEHTESNVLYKSVIKREKSDPTAIGHGCAIPHGEIANGPAIQGVMGICPGGIDWDAPDGQPVQIIVLIITPSDHREAHLKVLASVSAMAASEVMRSRLVAARNANEAWEVIESEETPNFNYFIEE